MRQRTRQPAAAQLRFPCPMRYLIPYSHRRFRPPKRRFARVGLRAQGPSALAKSASNQKQRMVPVCGNCASLPPMQACWNLQEVLRCGVCQSRTPPAPLRGSLNRPPPEPIWLERNPAPEDVCERTARPAWRHAAADRPLRSTVPCRDAVSCKSRPSPWASA